MFIEIFVFPIKMMEVRVRYVYKICNMHTLEDEHSVGLDALIARKSSSCMHAWFPNQTRVLKRRQLVLRSLQF